MSKYRVILAVVILPVIGLFVLGTSYFVSQRVNLFNLSSLASAETVVESRPSTLQVKAKKNFDLRLDLTTKKNFRETNIVITFDKDVLKLTGEAVPNAKLGKITKNTTLKEANNTGKIVIKTKSDTELKDINFLVKKMTFQGKSASATPTKVVISPDSWIKNKNGDNILSGAILKPTEIVLLASDATPMPVCTGLEITPISGTAPLQITANVSAIPINAKTGIKEYSFNFGDNSQVVTQANKTSTHTYTTGNTFEVSVTVKDIKDNVSESCSASVEVASLPTVQHFECQNNTCVSVPGAGTAATIATSCQSVDQRCGTTTVQEPVYHLACVSGACKKVLDLSADQNGCTTLNAACTGTTTTNTTISCTDKTDPRCYDCNKDGAVNMMDYACFAAVFGQNGSEE